MVQDDTNTTTGMPSALAQLAAAGPDVPLLFEKRYGKWTPQSRAEVAAEVADVARGIRDLGVGPGDTAVVLLASHVSWIVCDLGLQAAGVRVASAPSRLSAPLVHKLIAEAGARLVLVEDQHGADRVLEVLADDDSLGVEHVVYVNPAGVAEYDDDRLVALQELRDRGSAASVQLSELVAELSADDVAVVTTVFGADDIELGNELRHREVHAAARSTASALELTQDDRVMVVRNLADPVERGATLYPALVAGALVVMPENLATVGQATHETAPTTTHLTLRHLKEVGARVRVRMQSAKGLKRLVNRAWYRRFLQAVERGEVTEPAGLWKVLIGYPVLEKLGLDKARQVVVSGDHVPVEVVLFFRALGLRVLQAYALSQVGGLVALDTGGEGHDVGDALDGVEVRIADDGEVLVRGPALGVPVGDAAQADDDGWLHTGDIGAIGPDGHLAIHHRRDDRAAGGADAAASAALVRRLRGSPYISDATFDLTDGKRHLVVELMQSTVQEWARRRRIVFTTFHSLAATADVRGLVEQVVALASEETDAPPVDRLTILGRSLDKVPGALSPSGKGHHEIMVRLAQEQDAVPVG